jgi:hypothetical protein
MIYFRPDQGCLVVAKLVLLPTLAWENNAEVHARIMLFLGTQHGAIFK